MTNGPRDSQISKLAGAREGVFARGDAEAIGFTRRQIDERLRTGEWVREYPSIYRHAAAPSTDSARRRAAWLWAGAGAALSHRSAAVIWDIDGVTETFPEITITGDRHPRRSDVITHRSSIFIPGDHCHRDGMLITRPVRTLIDLAAVLESEPLENAIESARRQRLVTLPALEERFTAMRGRGRPGADVLGELVGALSGSAPSESAFEVKVARLLRGSSLPAPVAQHSIRIFGKRYRLDFAWPDWKLALECDSRRYHSFETKRARWRRIGASGWRVLPLTWRDVVEDWPMIEAELATALTPAELTIGR